MYLLACQVTGTIGNSGFSCCHHHHHHLSLNCKGRWGTVDDFATSLLHFSLFSTALWDLPKVQACPFLDVAKPRDSKTDRYNQRAFWCVAQSLFLYACESWILTAELQRRIQAMESATARYYASHTKTTLPTRKSVPRSSRQLDHMKIS